MKDTNTQAFKSQVWNYLIESARDVDDLTIDEKVQHIFNRFDREANSQVDKRHTRNAQKRVANWLSGLALNVDYTYSGIIATTEKWHDCKLTDAQVDRVTDGWFSFLAFKLMQLWREHDLNPF